MLKKVSLFLITFIFFLLVNSCNATDSDLKDATRVYINSKVTIGGDFALLETCGKDGNAIYGLIDTGNAILDSDENDTQEARNYLRNHNVKDLEFIIITHQHKDHTGNLIDIIDYIYEEANGKIGTFYMKEADSNWCNNNMYISVYSEAIKKIIQYNIKVIGISHTSLRSSIISPRLMQEEPDTYDEDFVYYGDTGKDAKKSNFEGFTYSNRKIKFGTAELTIFNWQIFDEDGNIISIDDNKADDDDEKMIKKFKDGSEKKYALTKENYNREKTSGENNNSLGILLTQGSKKAFFGGDINNRVDTLIGDEDRIKDAIGDVDFMKANHHGNPDSNTDDFLKTLKPEYMIITNGVGKGVKELKDYIKNNNVKYIYSGADTIGVSVTITNDDVYLGFEKAGEVKVIDNKSYYIPPDYKLYDNYDNYLYSVEYTDSDVSVSNWSELKEIIKNNNTEITSALTSGNTIDEEQKKIILKKLNITLNPGMDDSWIVNEVFDSNGKGTNHITIGKSQNITLDSTQNINIIRGNDFKSSMFYDKGYLSIGEKIVLDGNKTNITATSAIINISSGTLDLYGTIQNNCISNEEFKKNKCVCNGSGIFCIQAGKINIHNGAKVINNSQKVCSEVNICPENYEKHNKYKKTVEFSTYGAGIYMRDSSILNMEGGEISGNDSINESVVTCKNYEFLKSVRQYCYGAGIYAYLNSEINLIGGKVSNNIVQNNAIVKLYTPNSGQKTSINGYACMSFGNGICVENSILNVTNSCEISENKSTFNNKIILGDQAIFNTIPRVAERGGQVYCSKSDVIIDDAKIKNGSKAEKNKNNYASTIRDSIKYDDWGGAICITQDSNIDLNKLNITNCATNYRGGALYLGNCTGTITESVFENNKALEGGAIFNSSGNVKVEETIIKNNIATDYGGGIYNLGTTILINPQISYNKASKKSGGGICIEEGKVIIDGANSIIEENSCQNSGGGIFNTKNGICVFTQGKIKSNTALSGKGGGIYNNDGKLYKKDTESIYNNTATEGNQIYSTNNSLTDDKKPNISEIIIPDEYIKRRTDVTLIATDNIGVKTVKVKRLKEDGTADSGTHEISGNNYYNFTVSKNANYLVEVIDFFGNSAQTQFTISNIVKAGDVNSDGVVDIFDMFTINKYRLEKQTLQDKEIVAADVNDDGKVDFNDILKLNKYRLGKINSL